MDNKKINELLIDVLKLRIGGITDIIEQQAARIFSDAPLLSAEEITDYSLEFLELLIVLLQSRDALDEQQPAFKALRQFLASMALQIQSRGGEMEELVRYQQFIQSTLLEQIESDSQASFEDSRGMLMLLVKLFNELSLAVFQTYLTEKEGTIRAQQEELRQTSTPIVEIWDGVLTLPIIGSMDSARTMLVMDKLLRRIESDRARTIIIDVTGVQSVDSQVSHHLIQVVRAVRLMGAEAILTGIRADIARALASLNIDLGDVTTCATMAEGLKFAFRRLGVDVQGRLA